MSLTAAGIAVSAQAMIPTPGAPSTSRDASERHAASASTAKPSASQSSDGSASRSSASAGRPAALIGEGLLAPSRASSRAVPNTSSIIGSVSRPVNVFCWLGW